VAFLHYIFVSNALLSCSRALRRGQNAALQLISVTLGGMRVVPAAVCFLVLACSANRHGVAPWPHDIPSVPGSRDTVPYLELARLTIRLLDTANGRFSCAALGVEGCPPEQALPTIILDPQVRLEGGRSGIPLGTVVLANAESQLIFRSFEPATFRSASRDTLRAVIFGEPRQERGAAHIGVFFNTMQHPLYFDFEWQAFSWKLVLASWGM